MPCIGVRVCCSAGVRLFQEIGLSCANAICAISMAMAIAAVVLIALGNSAAVTVLWVDGILVVMLVIAYAASIGGIGTPVGTPPNLIALGQLETLAHIRIPFFQWMLLGVPVMLVMAAVLVGYLRWALPPEVNVITGSREHIAAERAALLCRP